MQLRGDLYLLGAAFIWGTTFAFQVTGMEELGPFGYAAARYLLGFFSVLAIWYGFRTRRACARAIGTYASGWKTGLAAGGIMFIATTLQQVGMTETTAGKTAFITALYIVLVPLGAVFLGRKIRRENWAGAGLAVVGLYLLSLHGSFSVAHGDVIIFISSFFWTAHILFVDRFAARVDAIELSVAQIFVCTVGSIVLAALFETVTAQALLHSWLPIFYGGVMSAGVAFTLQILGQQYAEPGPAAIIMSFESVFGALGGWLLLGEVLTRVEIMGCVLMFLGMLATQVGLFRRQRRRG